MKLTAPVLGLLAALALPALALPAQAEPRQAYSDRAPHWLRAVGKLHVPGVRHRGGRARHLREDCSGTLVATPDSRRANTVVTAWHCLEFYTDLSAPIIFTLLPDSAGEIRREAYRVADGGGMAADWAVLKLYQPVRASEVAALTPDTGRADITRGITMAGYSRDAGLGAGGTALTYHPNCRITRQRAGESESDCNAYKGASGGAVVQLAGDGRAQLSGVISRGNGESVSLFVPVAEFRGVLNRHLR